MTDQPAVTQQQPVTPPVAPVPPVPPVEQPKPPVDALSSATDKASDAVLPKEAAQDYITYNDPVADSIVGTFKAAKIPAAQAAELMKDAVQSGDISKLNKEALVKALGADAAELTIMRVEKFLSARTARVKEIVEITHSEAGSEDNWKKIITWANAKAEKSSEFHAELTEYAKMFDSGKTQAKLAASSLKKLYEADPNNSSLGVKMTQGDKTGTRTVDEMNMTRAQYVEKLKQAYKTGNDAEVQRLNNLRTATLQAGNK